ncbi:MAG: GTP 3',8-cyclase MoaA [Elusimicrobia bacterium]|nr:GTP 3',8-cyclase MoaA [Elusimicrobiota bacterium]
MRDGFNRAVDYLRLSVTDRCNLRCVYCMPESAPRYAPGADMLTDDEIVELAACFAQSGFSKIRITGGEPLVRPGLPSLIGRLSRVPGIADLALSTNGMLLPDMAAELKKAGLKRVNISLDSLDPARFSRIARFGALDKVLEGVEAALDSGLTPVKINVVVARGMNDDEIPAFAALTRSRPLHVRFIELMPMGETGFFSEERWVALREIMANAGPLEAVPPKDRPLGHGPARYYRAPGALGSIGFISALSCGFCASCNRVRLSSSGTLIACLDATRGTDLRGPLRGGANRARLKALIAAAVRGKPEGHAMDGRLKNRSMNPRLMCQIGG